MTPAPAAAVRQTAAYRAAETRGQRPFAPYTDHQRVPRFLATKPGKPCPPASRTVNSLPGSAAKRVDKLSSLHAPNRKQEAELLSLMELAGTFTPSPAYLERQAAGAVGAGDPSKEVYAVAWGNDGKITFYTLGDTYRPPAACLEGMASTEHGARDLVTARRHWQDLREKRIAAGEDLPEVHVFPFDTKLCVIDPVRDLGFTAEPGPKAREKQLKLMEAEGTFTPAVKDVAAEDEAARKRASRRRNPLAVADPQLDLWYPERAAATAAADAAKIAAADAARDELAYLHGAPCEFTTEPAEDGERCFIVKPSGSRHMSCSSPVRYSPRTAARLCEEANRDMWLHLKSFTRPRQSGAISDYAFSAATGLYFHRASDGAAVPDLSTGFPIRLYRSLDAALAARMAMDARDQYEAELAVLDAAAAARAADPDLVPYRTASGEDLSTNVSLVLLHTYALDENEAFDSDRAEALYRDHCAALEHNARRRSAEGAAEFLVSRIPGQYRNNVVAKGLHQWFANEACMDNAGKHYHLRDPYTGKRARKRAPWDGHMLATFPEGIPWVSDADREAALAADPAPFTGIPCHDRPGHGPSPEPSHVHCAPFTGDGDDPGPDDADLPATPDEAAQLAADAVHCASDLDAVHQPSAVNCAPDLPAVHQPSPDPVEDGLIAFFGGLAYVDNGGNYRLFEEHPTPYNSPKGKVAPWNKALKRAFPEGVPFALSERYSPVFRCNECGETFTGHHKADAHKRWQYHVDLALLDPHTLALEENAARAAASAVHCAPFTGDAVGRTFLSGSAAPEPPAVHCAPFTAPAQDPAPAPDWRCETCGWVPSEGDLHAYAHAIANPGHDRFTTPEGRSYDLGPDRDPAPFTGDAVGRTFLSGSAVPEPPAVHYAPFTAVALAVLPSPKSARRLRGAGEGKRPPAVAGVRKPFPGRSSAHQHRTYATQEPTMSIEKAVALADQFRDYMRAVNAGVHYAEAPGSYHMILLDADETVYLGETVSEASRTLSSLAEKHAQREADRKPMGRRPSAPRDAGVMRLGCEVAADLHAAFTASREARSLTLRAAVEDALRLWLASQTPNAP